jgi:hypothetical protein
MCSSTGDTAADAEPDRPGGPGNLSQIIYDTDNIDDSLLRLKSLDKKPAVELATAG